MSNYQRYLDASNKAVDFFIRNIAADGEFEAEGYGQDLGAIYKAPTLLLLGGKNDLANRLLEYIQRKFFQKNGDFLSFPNKIGKERRSNNALLQEFAPYMGGWIITAAQRLGRFDISMAGYDFIQSFWNPRFRGFIVDEPYDGSSDTQIVEPLINSHLGLIALFFRDMEKARGAADVIVKITEAQSELDTRFVFRMSTRTGKLISDRVASQATELVCFLKKKGTDEFFFMLGFPVIFLSKFYLATGEAKYLETAKIIIEFALGCDKSLYSFYLSHKVAYGAAILARITKEKKYVTLATRIADHLVDEQDSSGCFSAAKIPVLDDRYDQAGEIGTWLREIYSELKGV